MVLFSSLFFYGRILEFILAARTHTRMRALCFEKTAYQIPEFCRFGPFSLFINRGSWFSKFISKGRKPYLGSPTNITIKANPDFRISIGKNCYSEDNVQDESMYFRPSLTLASWSTPRWTSALRRERRGCSTRSSRTSWRLWLRQVDNRDSVPLENDTANTVNLLFFYLSLLK